MALTFPEIDPILVEIGPLAIRWYGLTYLIGFLFAIWLANRRADKPDSGWTKEHVGDIGFAAFMGAILGGRVGYILFYQFDAFLDNPLILFEIWKGGMSFHGGLLGVIAAFFWFAHKTQRPFFVVADFIAPLVPFGLGAGRIGNFINSELWGRVTDVPWGMIFPTGGNVVRHPSQLYQFALEGVALFLILNLFIRKPRPVGAVSGLFLICYGSFRFLVEFFREPDAHLGLFGGWISMGQILSIPMVLLGVLMMIWAYNRRQKHVTT